MSNKTKSSRPSKPAPKVGLQAQNTPLGSALELPHGTSVGGDLTLKGASSEVRDGEAADSWINTLVGNAKTITVTNMTVNINK